ncbi:MAG: N-formylglutamate amidohydrolase [Balneolaceae bacterium]|nr:N-formylglutamate amidohydrolase [Balneolaceae bacterium]
MSKEIVITCEHAGNNVPELYEHFFNNNTAVLKSHRGYDIGALELTRTCAKKLKVTPFVHSVTRLLIDLNRSLNSSELFSEFIDSLNEKEREEIVQNYYYPHRNNVEKYIADRIEEGTEILHLSVHTFTPKLNGTVRDVDVGLLFDPDRKNEQSFCQIWKSHLEEASDLRVRYNYPYPGVMDGFSTYLRTKFSDPYYAGLEVEVNQKFPKNGNAKQWTEIQELVGDTLRSAYRTWN